MDQAAAGGPVRYLANLRRRRGEPEIDLSGQLGVRAENCLHLSDSRPLCVTVASDNLPNPGATVGPAIARPG